MTSCDERYIVAICVERARERERERENGREWRDYTICMLLCLMYLSGVCVHPKSKCYIMYKYCN